MPALPVRLSLISTLSLLLANQLQASPYISAHLGQTSSNLTTSHFQAFNESVTNNGGSASLSKTDTTTGMTLTAGYQYTPNIAAEISYLNLGSVSATSVSSDTNSSGITRNRTIKESTRQSGISASIAGHYPINDQWGIQGRLGLLWLTQTAKGSATGESRDSTGSLVATESESSKKTAQQWRPVISLGTQYQLNPSWFVQANWQHVRGTEPGLLGKQDINLISLGLKHAF